MILDRVSQAKAYLGVHPGLAPAFEFLSKTKLVDLPQGKHEIDGERLFVLINHESGRGPGSRLEAHRKYLDIQIPLAGSDKIGWKPLDGCREPEPFEEVRDVGFFNDLPDLYFEVPADSFVIFFPHDAHAPLSGQGEIVKAVFKLRVEW